MNEVVKAINILEKGGIVIFPTDTAFGIGCRIDDEKAVKRLFDIRKRSHEKATPVLVDTVMMAQNYLKPIPRDVVDKLIEPYWPGALTIVLSCDLDKVPKLVRGLGSTLGVRIPNHPIARAIIRGLGVPVLGSSANFAGAKTPYVFSDLDPKLVKLVDYVVPGECSVKQASTVIDCTKKPWKVLREGAVIIQNSKFKNQKYNSKIKNDVRVIIDTSSSQLIKVGLSIDGKKDLIEEKIGKNRAQVVLTVLENLLNEHHLKFQDISDVQVNPGPGSFTGLRVGISIANALGFALGISVNHNPVRKFVEPVYE